MQLSKFKLSGDKFSLSMKAIMHQNLIISIIISLIISLGIFFFCNMNLLRDAKGSIIFLKKGHVRPQVIQLHSPLEDEFSFFTNVYIPNIKDKNGDIILLRDQSNRIKFIIHPIKLLGIRWFSGRTSFHRSKYNINTNRNVPPHRWLHVGFVFKQGTIYVFLDGNLCWEKTVKGLPHLIQKIQLLPGQKGSTATYSVLTRKALSPQHIKDLFMGSRLSYNLWIKLSILFFMGIPFFMFICMIVLPVIFSSKTLTNDTDTSPLYFLRRFIIFILSIVMGISVLFGSGYKVAAYMNHYFGTYGFKSAGVYFTGLAVLFLAFIFFYGLRKTSKEPVRENMIYVSGLVFVLIYTVTLCTLPGFNRIPPFIFNGLFAVFFSLLIAAPGILIIRSHIKGRR